MWCGIAWRRFLLVPGEDDAGRPDWSYGILSWPGVDAHWNQFGRGVILRPPGFQISAHRSHFYIARTDGEKLHILFGRLSRVARLRHMAHGTKPW